MLLGLVKPTSGSALVLGHPAGDRKIRTKIGFLPEHFRFYDWLTASELLRLHGRLYEVAGASLNQRIPMLLDRVGLAAHRDKQLRQFSKGMLQRIGLAQALLNEPDLLFLDEPTSGLDPLGRRLVRDVIKEQRERGATILLNSHLLSEVEVTCDRVAFIRAGEVVETRPLSSFENERCTVMIRARNFCEQTLAELRRWAESVCVKDGLIMLEVDCPNVYPEIVRLLVERGVEIFEFTPQKLSLEQRFLEIVGKDEGL